MRVQRKCLAMGCPSGLHVGTVWKPNREEKKANPGATEYEIAVRQGLCQDPLPADGSHYALVEFDDRPGVLQCYSWRDLMVVEL
jgi:hypothetical protein